MLLFFLHSVNEDRVLIDKRVRCGHAEKIPSKPNFFTFRVFRAQLIISYSLSCDYAFNSGRVNKKRFIYYTLKSKDNFQIVSHKRSTKVIKIDTKPTGICGSKRRLREWNNRNRHTSVVQSFSWQLHEFIKELSIKQSLTFKPLETQQDKKVIGAEPAYTKSRALNWAPAGY